MTSESYRPTVLVLAYYYPPDNTSGVFRTLYFFNHIARRNRWNVHVLTLAPEYYRPDQSRDEQLSNQVNPNIIVTTARAIHLRDMVIGLKHGRSPSNAVPPIMSSFPGNAGDDGMKSGRWTRFKDFVTDELLAFPDDKIGWLPFAYRAACRILREKKIDLIYSTGSPWTSHLLAWRLKKKFGLPLVLDYRDPWHGNPYQLSSHSYLYKRLSFGLEKKIIAAADRVLCNTQRLQLFYTREFGMDDKFITLPNGYEASGFPAQASEKASGTFVIVHAGSLYGGRSPDNFLHAVASIVAQKKGPRLRVVLVGAGEDVANRIALDFPGLHDVVKVTPRVDHEECLSYLLSADLLLLFQQGTKLQVPRKLYEYIMLRKPILGICEEGETEDIIRANNLGVTVPDKVTSIMITIEKLLCGLSVIDTKSCAIDCFDNIKLSMQLEDIFADFISK